MSRSKSTVEQIREHSRQLVRELDVVKGLYLGTGFTFSQCHILFELSGHKALNLLELADILLIDKSNASRTVKKLVELGLVKSGKVKNDNRQKLFSLTRQGESVLRSTVNLADEQVECALQNLSDKQQQTVIHGLSLYASALRKSRLQSGFSIRSIQKKDNPAVANVIRDVMTEFGAVGDGYSINDPEVDNIFAGYRDKRSCYFVITFDDEVVGGGGIGPLKGGAKSVCELRKMFFRSSARGIGLGQRLLVRLLNEARKRQFRKCYLETLDRMAQANQLYIKNGFVPLEKAMGNTGHCSCDRYYVLDL